MKMLSAGNLLFSACLKVWRPATKMLYLFSEGPNATFFLRDALSIVVTCFCFFYLSFSSCFSCCVTRQTFMRQKVTLSPSVLPSNPAEEGNRTCDVNIGPKSSQSVSCGSEPRERGTLCCECNGAGSLIIPNNGWIQTVRLWGNANFSVCLCRLHLWTELQVKWRIRKRYEGKMSFTRELF